MKDLKSIVTLAVILVVVLLATLAFVSNKSTSVPSQTASVENLDSDLNSLDATDLDTGFNSQLDQLSSDYSSF